MSEKKLSFVTKTHSGTCTTKTELICDRLLVCEDGENGDIIFSLKFNHKGNLEISSYDGLKILPKASNVLEILPDIDS